MIDQRFRVPLSPPNSPRMSDSAKPAEYQGQHASEPRAVPGYRSYRDQSAASMGYQEDVSVYPHDQGKSSSRSYKGYNYSPGPCHQYSHDVFSQNSLGDYQQRVISQRPQSRSSVDHHSTAYGASAPGSPVDRLTPRSPENSVRDQHDEDDLVDSAGDDQDEGPDKAAMTPAELRAHKRKMKRFRLTHSQTRFLMSEFARQAHPDAGHRERLAREIPGLSARQVQVWFQNRRAKLKRHTTDDQARMMRSRALPDDFDTTQALHSSFGAHQPPSSASISSLGTYSTYGEHGSARPLGLDVVRGVPEFDQYSQSYASPTGVSPALGAFAFTPPHSVSDHISPGSHTNLSPYALQNQAAYENSRRGPVSLPATEQGYPPHHIQRMPFHERLGRTSGEPMSSSLRTSISHSGLGSSNGQPHQLPERSSSFSDHTSFNHQRTQPMRNVGVTESESYGLGFSYTPPHTYQQSDQHQQPVPAQHTTDPDQFRRAPPMMAYNQYQPSSYTSAPYQNYPPQYAPRANLSEYPQQVQREPSAAVQQARQEYQSVATAPQPFMHPGNQITELQPGERNMPATY